MSKVRENESILTPMQRRLLREENERKLRIKIEYKKLGKQRMNLLKSMLYWEEPISQLQKSISKWGTESTLIDEIEEFKSEVIQETNEAFFLTLHDSLESMHSQRRIITHLNNRMIVLKKQLQQELIHSQKQWKENLLNQAEAGFTFSYEELGENRGIRENKILSEIRLLLAQLNAQQLPERLSREIPRIIERAEGIEDYHFLKNFKAVTVIPYLKECRKYEQAYEMWGEEYEELSAKYLVLAQEAGEVPKGQENKAHESQEDVSSEYECSEESVIHLREEVYRLEWEQQKQEEKEYISNCMKAVMEEMGYLSIGRREVQKKNGRRFINELYSLAEGVAINVTYAERGQISMEVGGLEYVDRIPDEEEGRQLSSDMEDFYRNRKKVEEELKNRGIILSSLFVLPPNAQYAQIINVEDYQLTTDIITFSERKKKRSAAVISRQNDE